MKKRLANGAYPSRLVCALQSALGAWQATWEFVHPWVVMKGATLLVWRHSVAIVAVVALSVAGSASPLLRMAPGMAPVAEAAPAPLSAGQLVYLRDTPHVWIADQQGVLHWVGDSLALRGRTVDWASLREVTRQELLQYPRGGPFVSAGFVTEGHNVFLARWEQWEPLPRLLLVGSPADLSLFGINGTNYGSLLFPLERWEQLIGIPAASLRRGKLAPTTPAPPLLASALTADELLYFLESAFSASGDGTLVKWLSPIRVEVTGTPGEHDLAELDRAIAALAPTLAPLPITRVSTEGNVVMTWVDSPSGPGDPGDLADPAPVLEARLGSLVRCSATLDSSVKEDVRTRMVWHGMIRCLGLGSNSSPASIWHPNWGSTPVAANPEAAITTPDAMSIVSAEGTASSDDNAASEDGTPTRPPLALSELDRKLITTLYLANVEPHMNRSQATALFGTPR